MTIKIRKKLKMKTKFLDEELGENSCERCLAFETDGITKTDEFSENI